VGFLAIDIVANSAQAPKSLLWLQASTVVGAIASAVLNRRDAGDI
jgi:hypothetical protein